MLAAYGCTAEFRCSVHISSAADLVGLICMTNKG